VQIRPAQYPQAKGCEALRVTRVPPTVLRDVPPNGVQNLRFAFRIRYNTPLIAVCMAMYLGSYIMIEDFILQK
jgi:hypothetical protein